MNLTVILVIVGAVGLAGMAGEGFLLRSAYEKQGALQASNVALAATLKQINDAQKERDAVHGTNIALPDDQLFKDLLK